MKTLATYHVCNHCVLGEKTFKNILFGLGCYRDFRETGPWGPFLESPGNLPGPISDFGNNVS